MAVLDLIIQVRLSEEIQVLSSSSSLLLSLSNQGEESNTKKK